MDEKTINEMSNLFIHMQPEAFQGFLSVFNEIQEGGDIFCYLEDYKNEIIKPCDLINIMEQSHYGVFGVAAHLPYQVKKMNMDIIFWHLILLLFWAYQQIVQLRNSKS